MRAKQHEGGDVDEACVVQTPRSTSRLARGTNEAIEAVSWDELLELETSTDPVFVVDGERIIALNTLAAQLVGATKPELIGTSLSTVIRTTCEELARPRSGVRFIRHDASGVEVVHRDRSTQPADLIVCATSFNASVVLVRTAPARGSVREEDMAEIVHDLKSPLSTIAIEAQVLGYRVDPTAPPSQVWSIERNVAYMDRLVHQLLDLCALDAGCFTLERRPIELRSLLERVLDRILPTQQRARAYLDADERVLVIGDEHRLERVIANLVENAVKYTPQQSEIIVRLRARSSLAIVSVIDRGPGLSPSDRERVFDKFKRAATGKGRGSGLGLYIGRKIIDAHGGRLSVESVQGVGSRFFFELPLARQGSEH